jgi:N-ethylmaleimide reductase
MKSHILFSNYKLGEIELKNRIVMAPMTRSRAIGNIPNDLMAEYYRQRSGAGLIITEGVSPSPNGLGYARIPGIFSEIQVEGWKKITSAVHKNGSKIFIQFMHTGRVGHQLNLPEGARLIGPSAVRPVRQIWTDVKQLQDNPVPEEMTENDIAHTIKEFADSAINSIKAGFDGVELHGANGYLLEQFLSPFTNKRTDSYGGNIESRCRFVLEVVKSVVKSIGKNKTGIRLSPYGVANDMPVYPEIDATYKYLAEQLNSSGIAYVHLIDNSIMGTPPVPLELKKEIRRLFKNTVILAGGYTKDKAETDLKNGLGDLIAFGKPFINNPDLAERLINNWPLATNPDKSTFYIGGEKGYTDYPAYVRKK